jgi:hypothetical protein
MKTIAGVAFVLFGLVGVGESQVKRQPARFEVVSIKPCANSAPGSPSLSPTRLRLNCVTDEDLILQAYIAFPNGVSLPKGVAVRDVELDAGASLQNAPSWVGSKRFTLEVSPLGVHGQGMGEPYRRGWRCELTTTWRLP